MIAFVITLGVCTLCGFLVKKTGIPGALIIGAMAGAAALHILTPWGYMPKAGKFAAQVISGAYIGALFDRRQLRQLPRILPVYGVVMVSFTAANLLGGYLIWRTGACDLMTALMACVPGGVSDTPLIAAELGADVSTVAILQFVRMFVGVAVIPTVISLVTPKSAAPQGQGRKTSGEQKPDFLLTLISALLGGGVGKWSHIPAGTLVGAMTAVMVMNLGTGKAWMPVAVKRAAQILSGAYIGCTMTLESLLSLKDLLLPAGIILGVYLPLSFLSGMFISRVLRRELRESMLCCTPGGASDMALIASDLGVESTDLLITQILRMITVVLVFPQLIWQLCRYLG